MRKKGLLLFFSCIVTFFTLEIAYRYSWIDWYKAELISYNPSIKSSLSKPVFLIMGDSFTAGKENYPSILQKKLSHYRIINSAVSGTGIIQAEIIAQRRIKMYQPSLFLYQLYTGNDLFDIEYPVHWEKVSFIRNLYWSLANNFRILSFINYKLGKLKVRLQEKAQEGSSIITKDDIFSVERYSKREKIYLKAEAGLIEDSVLLKGRRKKNFSILLNKLQKIVQMLPSGSKVFFMVVPHSAQVSQKYLQRTIHLGGSFRFPDKVLQEEYPFITELRIAFPSVTVINPLAKLREAEKKGKQVYYANDGHLNRYGQALLADSFLSMLQARK